MTDQAPPATSTLPSGEVLAVEVIAALIGEGYTSSLLKLPRPVLNEMARQLVTDWPPSEELEEWFAGKGHEVPARNIRRFVKRFREKYNVVVGKHVMAQALAEQSADGALTEFNRSRIQQVIAQKLMTITPEEMDPAELATIIRGIRLEDMREHDTESLKLAAEQSAAKVAKLEADLALSVQQADHRERELASKLDLAEQRTEQMKRDAVLKQERIEDRLSQLQTRLNDFAKRAARGERITEEELKFADADLEAARGAAA